MRIIGICGQSGSGKSTFASLFQKRNIPVLDCDEIYHKLINSPSLCLNEIGKQFGMHLIKNNSLDRKSLGKIVFSDSEQLAKLNQISHYYVLDELKKSINDLESKGELACVIDAPMLFEAGLEKWCDVTCCVVATKELQLDRICKRDHITVREAESRLFNQAKSEELLKKCTFIVYNNGDILDLENQFYRILNQLKLSL